MSIEVDLWAPAPISGHPERIYVQPGGVCVQETGPFVSNRPPAAY